MNKIRFPNPTDIPIKIPVKLKSYKNLQSIPGFCEFPIRPKCPLCSSSSEPIKYIRDFITHLTIYHGIGEKQAFHYFEQVINRN